MGREQTPWDRVSFMERRRLDAINAVFRLAGLQARLNKKTMFDARNKAQPKLVYAHVSNSQPEQQHQKEVEIKITPASAASGVKDEQKLQQSALLTPSTAHQQRPQEQLKEAPSSPKVQHQQRQHLLQHQESLKRQKQELEQQQQQKQLQMKQSQGSQSPSAQQLLQVQSMGQTQPLQQQPASPSLRLRLQQQQQQRQQQQPAPASQQPQKHTVIVTSTIGSTVTDTAQQNGYIRSTSPKLPDKASVDKPQLITTDTDISNIGEKMEELRLYKGKVYEVTADKGPAGGAVVRSGAPTTPTSSDMAKRQIVVTSTGNHKAVSIPNTVPNQVLVGKIVKSSNGNGGPSKTSYVQTHQPHYQALQQQYLYPNYHNSHQQNHQHQQHQQQQQQQIFRDHHKQIQESRAPAFRVQGHSQFRGPPTATLPAPVSKTGNGNGTPAWTIPRATGSGAGMSRPHSVNVASSVRPQEHAISSSQRHNASEMNSGSQRHHGNDASSGSQRRRVEFANHVVAMENAPGSPGTMSRSSYKLDPDMHAKQAPANPPKSILKNNLSLEQSDLYFSSRPLVLPRAKSEKGSHYPARDFDFSSILTTNKDPLSSLRPPSIKVKGQILSQPVPPHASPSFRSKRPNTAGPAVTNYELIQDEQPQRKSVTFNSQVLLHVDN